MSFFLFIGIIDNNGNNNKDHQETTSRALWIHCQRPFNLWKIRVYREAPVSSWWGGMGGLCKVWGVPCVRFFWSVSPEESNEKSVFTDRSDSEPAWPWWQPAQLTADVIGSSSLLKTDTMNHVVLFLLSLHALHLNVGCNLFGGKRWRKTTEFKHHYNSPNYSRAPKVTLGHVVCL